MFSDLKYPYSQWWMKVLRKFQDTKHLLGSKHLLFPLIPLQSVHHLWEWTKIVSHVKVLCMENNQPFILTLLFSFGHYWLMDTEQLAPRCKSDDLRPVKWDQLFSQQAHLSSKN